MPVGNENNENIKGSAENTQGGKSAAPKKKLNVVFRKQNSTSIKELPKRLKNAADGGEPKVKEDVQAAVKKVADELGYEGRILLRESGTEPVIRVMVEAGTDELCKKYVDEVVSVLYAKGHGIK